MVYHSNHIPNSLSLSPQRTVHFETRLKCLK